MGSNMKKFSWVETHKELVQFLSKNKEHQQILIGLLKKVGVTGFSDKDENGESIELDEIDPFTFFCYIYKYGPDKRLKILQRIANEIQVKNKPTDELGIPSAQAQQVWLFPHKAERIHSEISRLWDFFFAALDNTITDDQFNDILKIRGTGKAKLTEALFYINPEKYFPINGPSIPYLKEELQINPKFNSYSYYLDILERTREKITIPFYELSYEAWKWNKERGEINYWIFQGNPKKYNSIDAISDNALKTWSVTSFKPKIKKGDKAILWVTGKKAGCYALCEITSEVYDGLDEKSEMKYYTSDKENEISTKVKINITHNLSSKPITKKQIESIDELSNLKVGNQGTNFSATEEEYLILLEMAESQISKKYWLYSPGKNAELWEEFQKEGIMALGWNRLGDLNKYNSKEEIASKLQEIKGTTRFPKNDATANIEFKEKISIGDIVIVKKGRGELLGLGVIASDYYFDETRESYQKCRNVEWKKKGNWKTDHTLALKTLTDITDYPSDHQDYDQYYKRLLGIMDDNEEYKMKFSLNTIFYGPPGTGKTYNTIIRAAEIIENRIISDFSEAQKVFNDNLGYRIEFITFHQNYSYEDFIQGLRPDVDNVSSLSFERKDGVFKRIADKALENLKLSEKAPEEVSKELLFENAIQKFIEEIQKKEDIYSINDNVYIFEVEEDAFRYKGEQWLSNPLGSRMKFSDLREFYRNGVKSRIDIKNLKTISGLARQHATYYLLVYQKISKLIPKKVDFSKVIPKHNYVIIIDEINRANISRVFGELITLIEPDKRSNGSIPLNCTLPSGEEFVVPSNLYVIGTMNTADKSIALLDIALRRRFNFEAMYPQYEIDGHEIYDVDILKKINESIIKLKGYDFQIGHSFFMGENIDLSERMNSKVIPLLLEYFMNDEKEVKGILTNAGLFLEQDSWPLRINGSL
jgi:5-methylcytosine-specific restriction protein B